MPTHHDVVGDSVRTVLRIVSADDGEFIGLLREHRQRIAEANAGQRGRDSAELTANLGGSVGLGVECVDVRRAALHPHKDAAFRFHGSGRRLCPCLEVLRQAEAEGAEATDAKEATA